MYFKPCRSFTCGGWLYLQPSFYRLYDFCLVIVCTGKTDSKRWTFLVESKAKSVIVLIVIYRQMFDKIADWSWLCYHDLICLVNFTFLVSRKNHIPLFSSIRLSGKDTSFFRYNWVQYVVLFYFSHAERYAAQRMSRMSVNQVLARYLQLCMSFILGKNKHLIN